MKFPILLALPFLFINQIFAQGDAYKDNLLNYQWRGELDQKGIKSNASHKIIYFNNLRGGKKTGTILSNDIDLRLTFDGQKFLNSPDSKLFIHFISNYDGHLNREYVGSNLGIINTEVDYCTTKLDEIWFEQKLFDKKLSILAGIYSLDNEFYVTNSTGNFLGPTYGTGAEFADSGKNGPSIFPNTSPAIRILINPTDKIYLQTAILNGVAGNPDLPRGTHYRLNKDDGILQIVEIGAQEDSYKVALGGWYYSKRFDDYMEKDINGLAVQCRSQGSYFLAEKSLHKFNEKQEIWGFFRAGNASKEMNPIEYSYSLGLVYNGIIKNRDDSQLGIGFAQVRNSSGYLLSKNLTKEYESAFEVYYSDKLTSWCSISPNIQYVIHPGSLNVENAFLIGMQLTLLL